MRNKDYKSLVIGGTDYSPFFRFPFTYQANLNEQLDSAVVDLYHTPYKDPFKPFEKAVLGGATCIVAQDVVTEIVGKNLYNHSITLVEETKEAERIICGAKSFTTPLVNDYADGASPASFEILFKPDIYWQDNYIFQIQPGWDKIFNLETFTSPIRTSDGLTFYSLNKSINYSSITGSQENFDAPVRFSIYYTEAESAFTLKSKKEIYTEGWYEVEYELNPSARLVASGVVDPNQTEKKLSTIDAGNYTFFVGPFWKNDFPSYDPAYLIFTIQSVESAAKKDPLTIETVINRLLETAETMRSGLDTARYRLEYTDDQEAVMQQPAPEFHFGNGRSLWENLREIGQYIHAIPRITDGVLTFEDLGGVKKANLRNGRRISNTSLLNIEEYTACLDSVAENLINQDDWSDGCVTEPYEYGYVAMRTTGESARIEENTGVLLTSYPVEKIISVKVKSFTHDGITYPLDGGDIDITPYIFEKSEYDMLSSASGEYPNSKTYALYFTQGEKNISGFWYRAQDSASNIVNNLEKYSIMNVLRAKLGLTKTLSNFDYINSLVFNITYIPTVSARIRQHKPNYKGGFPSAMAYNQSANSLSAVAFGENLRGQLAMMSNTSDTVTYMFQSVEDVPKTGKLYDDKRYITSTTTRVFNDFVICQMTLAEGYNEIGAYVETNNKIRQFEIPKSRDRYTILEEFCVVSDKNTQEDSNTAASLLKDDIIYEFSEEAANDRASKAVSLALVTTFGYDGYSTSPYGFALPAVTLAVGNSLYFGFRFEDNISAGVAAETPLGEGVKYKMARSVPYGDKFYAEALLLKFEFYAETYPLGNDVAFSLPDAYRTYGTRKAISTGSNSIIWHKDSAEAGCVTYQMHFVTDADFIIGDGLAYWCRSVRKVPSNSPAKMYFFDRRINQLTGTTYTGDSVGRTALTVDVEGRKISPAMIPDREFKSWAIVKDGKFVLGQNSSTVPQNIYFNFKRRLS